MSEATLLQEILYELKKINTNLYDINTNLDSIDTATSAIMDNSKKMLKK